MRHRPPGYALDIDSRAIDFRRFEELLSRGRAALGRDDPGGAAADLRTALALWRGEALADYRFDEFAQREIARLEELRLEAIEERLAADLAAGGGEDLVGELQALVAEHPLRERLRGQLDGRALPRRVGRPRRWRPCAPDVSCWWTSSDSSPARSCGGSSG